VEDNQQVRDLAERLLKQMGYTVLAADGGAAALAMLDSLAGPLHLLLTDVVMPEMNGRELFDRVSVSFPQLRVIYMSGYTDDLIVHRGVLEQGVHFIQKPFSTRNLIAKVRAVLDEDE
jgi:CheY-like chemotaxis protein